MPVVSNTTPLLNLAIIEHLHLLQDQFGEIVIPVKVRAELKVEQDLPGSKILLAALTDGWIETREVQNGDLSKALSVDLDDGEAEAIALALELDRCLVLMDESEGRSRARNLGLNVAGTLGVLLRAKIRQKIQEIKPLMLELQSKAGFYIADDLYQSFLREAQEG